MFDQVRNKSCTWISQQQVMEKLWKSCSLMVDDDGVGSKGRQGRVEMGVVRGLYLAVHVARKNGQSASSQSGQESDEEMSFRKSTLFRNFISHRSGTICRSV